MTRPLPPHTDQAHAAITAELIRLTLPHHPESGRPALELTLPDPTVLARIRTKRCTRRTTRRSR